MGADVPEKECTCDKAKRWKYREEIKETAAEKIDFLFGVMKDGFTGYGDVPIPQADIQLLNDMVPHLLDGNIKAVTIAVPGICKCTMSMPGIKIKISRTQSKTVQEDV